MGSLMMHGWPTRSHNLKEDQVSLPQSPWLEQELVSWNGDGLDLVQVATVAGGHEHSSFDMSRRHCSLGSSPTVALTIFLPLFCNGPWSLGGEEQVWCDCLICGWTHHRNLLSVLWPVASSCINCHPLHKETSLRRSEHCSNLTSYCS